MLDRVKRIGWFLANRCFFCLEEEETIDHILIHCVKTRVLWNFLFSLFGVLWVLSFSVGDMLLGWHSSFVGKRRKNVWRTAPFCLFWTIWKERNRRAFKNEEQSIQHLKCVFLCNLWNWSRLFLSSGPSSILDFVDWVGSFSGRRSFFLVPLLLFSLLSGSLYTSCVLQNVVLVLFVHNTCLLYS